MMRVLTDEEVAAANAERTRRYYAMTEEDRARLGQIRARLLLADDKETLADLVRDIVNGVFPHLPKDSPNG